MVTRVVLTALTLATLAASNVAAQRNSGRPRRPLEPGAPRIELSAMSGWMFGTSLEGSYNATSASIGAVGGVPYGAAIAFRMTATNLAEVSWTMLPSALEVTDRGLQPDTTVFDMAVHYVHFASVVEVRSGPMRPFGMGSLGVTIFHPENAAFDDAVRFSLGAGAGFKAYLGQAERIGLRGQVRGWITFVGASGGGIICGGGGCAGTWSGYGLLQADFTGGVFLAF